MSTGSPVNLVVEVVLEGTRVPIELSACKKRREFLTETCTFDLNGVSLLLSTVENKKDALRLVIHKEASKPVVLRLPNCSEVHYTNSLWLFNLGDYALISTLKATCYYENDIGPYELRELNVNAFHGNGVELLIPETPINAKCDVNAFLAKKTLLNAYADYLKRPLKGYVDDVLIWALIRSGRVEPSTLPSFIANGQMYYWPRSDVFRESLYTWYSFDDEVSLLVCAEILEQIVSQMNECGGLVIPYVTAAKMRNICGAPQQLYAFEALYRGYQLLGEEALKNYSLKALECFLIQPPKCLGFYEVGGGMWFRWGSYHYLSTEPDKRENLLVLNTHLMGVDGFAEACLLTGNSSYCEYAERGVQALKGVLNDLRDSSGYFHYGLYTKIAYGGSERELRPDLLGYHVLSSTLMTKIGRLLRHFELVELGTEGCMYGYKELTRGRVDISQSLAKCFVECYKAQQKAEYLDLLLKTLSHSKESLRVLGYTLDECDGCFPPAVRIRGDAKALLLLSRDTSFKYIVCSKGSSVVEFAGKKLPRGVEVHVGGVNVEVIQGSAYWLRENLVELRENSCVIVDVQVVKYPN